MTPNTLTTQPIFAATVTSTPEFATIADSRRLFGMSRSSLYELEKEGRIRFVRLRKPGNVLGKVLVDCASVRAFLAQAAEESSTKEEVA